VAKANSAFAGGARSYLRDYGRLLHLLLNEGWANGQRLLSRDAVYRFWHDNVGNLPAIDELSSAQCELIETVDDVFAEGMEGNGAPR